MLTWQQQCYQSVKPFVIALFSLKQNKTKQKNNVPNS